MTHNQINYWNLQETGRHNKVTEVETERHNRAGEAIDLGRLQETNRHNLVTEGQTDRSLGYEEQRLGIERDKIGLGYAQLSESSTHNRATEGIEMSKLGETSRHNQVTEQLTGTDLSIKQDQVGETIRHNTIQEQLEKSATLARNNLLTAQTEFQEINNTYQGLLNSQHVAMNETTKSKIAKEIEQINTSIKKMETDIRNGNINTALNAYSTISESIGSVSEIIDALIPG